MRRLLSLALLLPLAACTEQRSEPMAPESGGDPFASQHQASFPLVIVRQGPGTAQSTQAGAPVVDNIADALERVATDGTIRVQPGTYPTSVGIHRPVTIVGNGTGPTLVPPDGADGPTAGLTINSDGNTTIRNLRLEGYTDAIQVGESPETDPYDLVVIEEVHIATAPGQTNGVSVFGPQSPDDGRTVIVRNSTVVGGWRGISAGEDVHNLVAIGNALIDQNFPGASAAAFSRGASGTIQGNSFTGCDNCVNVGGGDRTAGVVDIVGNDFTIGMDHQIPNVIVASGLDLRVAGNVVTGVGGARDPNDDSTWPINSNAILIESTEEADVSGNSVSGAWIANSIGFNTGTVTGLNNTADDVQTGFQAFSVDGSLSFRSSDFTNYHQAMNVGDAGFDLTCNWWGSADGPHDANAPSDDVYTPWATAPVAGTSTTSCSGGQ